MRRATPSPKSEGRSPKEGRTPKAEDVAEEMRFEEDSAFWTWGDDAEGELALHEGWAPAGPSPPDLEERTALFGEAIVRFVKTIPTGPATNRLIDQLVGAGTSVGANYAEAQDAVSRKDFRNRVGTSRKESKETMFFLRMVAVADESLAPEARRLWREARELNRIFGSIWRK